MVTGSHTHTHTHTHTLSDPHKYVIRQSSDYRLVLFFSLFFLVYFGLIALGPRDDLITFNFHPISSPSRRFLRVASATIPRYQEWSRSAEVYRVLPGFLQLLRTLVAFIVTRIWNDFVRNSIQIGFFITSVGWCKRRVLLARLKKKKNCCWSVSFIVFVCVCVGASFYGPHLLFRFQSNEEDKWRRWGRGLGALGGVGHSVSHTIREMCEFPCAVSQWRVEGR